MRSELQLRTDEPVIRKARHGSPTPNMADYDAYRRTFTWGEAYGLVSGLPCGHGLNMAYEAVDRHAFGSRAEHVAIRWLPTHGDFVELTYQDLSTESDRFANVLSTLGVREADRVCTLTGRIPELYVAALGALKRRAVFCPVFAASDAQAVKQRIVLASPKAFVTTERLYRSYVEPIRHELGAVEHFIVIADAFGDEPATRTSSVHGLRRRRSVCLQGVHDWAAWMRRACSEYTIEPTSSERPALLHFTGGATERPEGVLHAHESVVMHQFTGRVVLDLHPNDVYWYTQDPGSVTGTSCGIFVPLTNGITTIVDEADFEARRCYDILERHRVTVWCTEPRAIDALRRDGAVAREHDVAALRLLCSVGEPLAPEAVVWSERVFGNPFHDAWAQAETGGILISNYACMDVRPGSMGKPLPGIEAMVVRRAGSGVTVLDGPCVEGELAFRRGWPSMFRGYIPHAERYPVRFVGDWYLTGDRVARDADGYYWFVGRVDEGIRSA